MELYAFAPSARTARTTTFEPAAGPGVFSYLPVTGLNVSGAHVVVPMRASTIVAPVVTPTSSLVGVHCASVNDAVQPGSVAGVPVSHENVVLAAVAPSDLRAISLIGLPEKSSAGGDWANAPHVCLVTFDMKNWPLLPITSRDATS